MTISAGCDVRGGMAILKDREQHKDGDALPTRGDNTRRAAQAPRPQIAQYLHGPAPTPGPSRARTLLLELGPTTPAVRRRTLAGMRVGVAFACAFLIGRAPR